MTLKPFCGKLYEPCVWLTTAFSRSVLWAARKIRFSPLRSLELRRYPLRGYRAAAPLKQGLMQVLLLGLLHSPRLSSRGPIEACD